MEYSIYSLHYLAAKAAAKKARVDDYEDLFSGDDDDEVDSVSLMDEDEFDNFIAHTAGFTEYVSKSSTLLTNTHSLQHYVNYLPLLVPATTLPTSLNISGSVHTHESAPQIHSWEVA